MSESSCSSKENEQATITVEYETILEMLGGTQYFTREQVMYVYLSLNNCKEEAKQYLNDCLSQAHSIERHFYNKMKSPEEIGVTI